MENLSLEEIRELAKQIAITKLSPLVMEIDQSGEFPWDNIHSLGEAGFYGIGVSEDDGGIGGGRVCFASIVKELSQAYASTALVYVSHSIVTKAIEMAGNEAVKKKWLPEMLNGLSLGAFAVHESESGSNAGAITTRAKKDGDAYIVNGSKFFITSAGEANIYLMLVRTDQEKGAQGMSTLLIEKDTPGLSFGQPEDKMGLRSTSSRQMFFNECRVPAENLIGNEGEGVQIIGKTVIGWGFFGAAAISAGIAKSAVELSIKHAKDRNIAGQPIGVHQAVQFLITNMVLWTDAVESLLDTCSHKADSAPEKALINGFKSKLFASETAVDSKPGNPSHGWPWVLP